MAISDHFLANLFETVQAILEIDRVIDKGVRTMGIGEIRAAFPRIELQKVVTLSRAYIARCVNDVRLGDFKYRSTRARGYV